MAFVSAEYVKTLQKSHDAKYWKVFDSSGKVTINKLDQDIGLSASQDMLQETIENCIGDYVIVKLYTMKPERREAGVASESGLTLKVRLEGSSQMGFQKQPSSHSFIGQPTWMDMMSMSERLRGVELEKLRMELEEKEQSPLARIAEKLLENDALIIALTGVLGRMAGSSPQRTIAAPQSQDQSIDQTLSRLQRVDPDIENTLSKMAVYLEANPSVLGQIKTVIGA
jgi:hypothetical protein